MVKIILAAHGDFAQAMLDTAAKIMPFDTGEVDVYTVSGKVDFEKLAVRIKKSAGGKGGALILTDIFGGTACNLCAGLTHGIKNVNVISGLNLNMLLCALSNRCKLDANALAAKVLEDGLKSIINITEKLGK